MFQEVPQVVLQAIVKKPLYEIELWNVRKRVEHNLARTNNAIEGSHRAMQVN
jgi:hypothetical protein